MSTGLFFSRKITRPEVKQRAQGSDVGRCQRLYLLAQGSASVVGALLSLTEAAVAQAADAEASQVRLRVFEIADFAVFALSSGMSVVKQSNLRTPGELDPQLWPDLLPLDLLASDVAAQLLVDGVRVTLDGRTSSGAVRNFEADSGLLFVFGVNVTAARNGLSRASLVPAEWKGLAPNRNHMFTVPRPVCDELWVFTAAMSPQTATVQFHVPLCLRLQTAPELPAQPVQLDVGNVAFIAELEDLIQQELQPSASAMHLFETALGHMESTRRLWSEYVVAEETTSAAAIPTSVHELSSDVAQGLGFADADALRRCLDGAMLANLAYAVTPTGTAPTKEARAQVLNRASWAFEPRLAVIGEPLVLRKRVDSPLKRLFDWHTCAVLVLARGDAACNTVTDVYVSVRGTDKPRDWGSNVHLWPRAGVHGGFDDFSGRALLALREFCAGRSIDLQAGAVRVHIAGHSLGAAAAAALHGLVLTDLGVPAQLVHSSCFATPTPFFESRQQQLLASFPELPATMHHFVHRGDPVPTVVPYSRPLGTYFLFNESLIPEPAVGHDQVLGRGTFFGAVYRAACLRANTHSMEFFYLAYVQRLAQHCMEHPAPLMLCSSRRSGLREV